MGDGEPPQRRRNPERGARATRPQETEGGEEPPEELEPTAEEIEAARQERLRQDAEARVAADREAERQEHRNEGRWSLGR